MPTLATGTDATVVPVVESGANKKITLASLKSYAVDYPVTNRFYIDPARTDTYTPTGNANKPFKTLNAAYTYIKNLIATSVISPAETNPIFMILQGNITENITLDTGHIFLVGDNGSIHAPIYLFGTVTISGSATGAGALGDNHFSIAGLAINALAQKPCIYYTGANAQRLFLQDVWMTATGNQTGSTVFTDAGGYGIYADCSGTEGSSKSVIHGNSIKLSHNGTGDVYCIQVGKADGTSRVSLDLREVESSGAAQVASVNSNCTMNFSNSELTANNEVCLEAYGTGAMTIGNCIIGNNSTGDSYGIWLHSAGSAAIVINSVFSVVSSTGASRAVKGVAGTVYVYANNFVGKGPTLADYNAKIDSAITRIAATSTLTAV